MKMFALYITILFIHMQHTSSTNDVTIAGTSLDCVINSQQQAIKTLNEVIRNVTAKNEILEETLAQNVHDLNDLKQKYDGMQEKLDRVTLENDKLKDNFTQMQEVFAKKELHQAVAYTAYQSRTFTYSTSDVIKFEATVTNFGNFFNATSYAFNCPINGLYLFTATLFVTNKTTWQAAIVVVDEGNVTKERFMFTQSGTTVAMGNCQSGWRAYVTMNTNDVRVFGSITRKTSFSGALLYVL